MCVRAENLLSTAGGAGDLDGCLEAFELVRFTHRAEVKKAAYKAVTAIHTDGVIPCHLHKILGGMAQDYVQRQKA